MLFNVKAKHALLNEFICKYARFLLGKYMYKHVFYTE
jgi:hypothetical protein